MHATEIRRADTSRAAPPSRLSPNHLLPRHACRRRARKRFLPLLSLHEFPPRLCVTPLRPPARSPSRKPPPTVRAWPDLFLASPDAAEFDSAYRLSCSSSTALIVLSALRTHTHRPDSNTRTNQRTRTGVQLRRRARKGLSGQLCPASIGLCLPSLCSFNTFDTRLNITRTEKHD